MVTNIGIRNYFTLKYDITLSKMAVSKNFKRLGLTWKKVTNKKRSVGEYCRDLLRTFIIEFDKVMTAINRDLESCAVILVYTDESYIHRNRNSKYLYMKKIEVPIERSNNKGEMLIIIHAITPHGVMAEELSKLHVSDLQLARRR
jgi:hypothetical protein